MQTQQKGTRTQITYTAVIERYCALLILSTDRRDSSKLTVRRWRSRNSSAGSRRLGTSGLGSCHEEIIHSFVKHILIVPNQRVPGLKELYCAHMTVLLRQIDRCFPNLQFHHQIQTQTLMTKILPYVVHSHLVGTFFQEESTSASMSIVGCVMESSRSNL